MSDADTTHSPDDDFSDDFDTVDVAEPDYTAAEDFDDAPPATTADDQPGATVVNAMSVGDFAETDEPAIEVPSDLSSITPADGFTASSYGPTLTGSGAAKMVDSAVAPLVALARGYATVVPSTLRDFAARYGLGAMNSKHGRQLAGNVGEHDAMMMPWYSPEDVTQAETRRAQGCEPSLAVPRYSSLQVRPHELAGRTNEKGQRLKYDIFSGQSSVLGVHPATPVSWLRDAPVTFVTEGAIKGDSAITGLLRHCGVTDAQLAVADTDDQLSALLRLHALMETVPVAERVLVVTLVGVGNWHANPDWNSFRLKDRKVWVAFDGDVASNINVFHQADQLWTFLKKRNATPHLLDLAVPTENADGEKELKKVGVDDYLAKLGSWDSLVARLSASLPERPVAEEEIQPGEWRVNESGKCCEELVESQNDFGQPVRKWVRKAGFAARITAVETTRFVRDSEMRTGVLEETVDGGVSNSAEVLFEWNPTSPGDTGAAVVQGPGTMMADPPDQWHRRGAKLPPALANHPDWPPRSAEWARAVKRHKRDEILDRAVWNQMGWVPTADDGMVFIAGNDVVGRDGATAAAIPGVDDHQLDGASKFGLNPPEDDDQAREAIRAMLSTYLSSPWNDRRVAAIAIATGLRPVVPINPRCPILITGPRRRGKTWTAEAMMAFWQAHPGSFGEMPGSASDTKYSMENAIARVPIWVADDLAPNADRRKSDAQQSKIGEIVRAMFNGSGQRRMNSDGTTREVLNPRAVFISTAENALVASSEMDRLVHISTGDKFLNSTAHTKRLEMMSSGTVTQNMVATTCIMTIAQRAARLGWPDVRQYWIDAQEAAREEARHSMSMGMDASKVGEASRHAKIAADLSLGLRALMDTCDRLEMEEELEIVANLFDDLYSLVSDCFTAQKNTTPGAALIQALRSVLASGRAHLVAPGLAGPPVPASDSNLGSNAAMVNQRLGWPIPSDATDSPRPTGSTIGYVIAARDGSLHALFEPKASFAVAQQYYPDLLLPGMRAEATWSSVWSEDLASPHWSRKKGGSGLTSTVRAQKTEGVPVSIETLLGIADEDDAENDVDAEAERD